MSKIYLFNLQQTVVAEKLVVSVEELVDSSCCVTILLGFGYNVMVEVLIFLAYHPTFLNYIYYVSDTITSTCKPILMTNKIKEL